MRSGNRVRIAAQLIQARNDQHLWAESYERDLDDVLRLQSELAQAIAQQIRVQLTPQQQSRLGVARSVNPAAYEAYLKGRFYESAAFETQQDVQKVQSYFEEAIRKDPSFALAYVGLADCYRTLGDFRWLAPEDADLRAKRAKQALRKALDLDETLGEAHTTLGYLSWRHDWDWRTAEKEFNRALEVNPNSWDAHAARALYLGWSGRRDEALAEVVKLRELNPAWSSDEESAIYYHLRDYKALLEVSTKHQISSPNDWLAHYFAGAAYEGLGQQPEAIPEYQKAVALSHGDNDPAAGLAHAYAVSGKRPKRRKYFVSCYSSRKLATFLLT
jgi:tetratricopeptide (TPR) repeat protein